MKLLKLLKVTGLIASVFILTAPAHANMMSYDIDVHLVGVDFGEGFVNEFREGVGSATFDAPASDGLALLVDFDIQILSAVFTENDDLDFPDAPWATIEGGEMVGIDFSGVNGVGAILRIDDTFAFSVLWSRTGHIVRGSLDFRRTSGDFTSVVSAPEPSAGLVFAIGLVVVAPWLRRSR